jgi:uncharacterized membrane protein
MIYLILLVSLAIRLISLNQSLWLDEGTTALVAKLPLSDVFTKFLPGDFHPPLYYLIVKLWTVVFGYSEISLRMPSVIFGIAAVYMIYLIGRKVQNNNLGLLASAFIATSGLMIYYSQEARMYSLVVLLACLAVYGYIQKKWILFSVSLALVGLTDYVALCIVPVFFIFNPKDYKRMIVCLIPLVLSYMLWLPTFVKQISGGLTISSTAPLWWQLLGETSLKNLILIPTKFIFGRISFDNKTLYTFLDVILGSVFLGLMLRGSRSRSSKSKLLWLWLAVPVVIAVIIGFRIPILSYFRLIFVLPAMYLLLAHGILTLKRNLFLTAVIFVLAVNTCFSFAYLTNLKFQREDWRALTSFVESNKDRNSVTIFVADSNMEAYRYYAPNAKIAGPKGVISGYDQLWLMRYLQAVFDENDKVRSKVEALGYKKAESHNFNGVEVWEYIK